MKVDTEIFWSTIHFSNAFSTDFVWMEMVFLPKHQEKRNCISTESICTRTASNRKVFGLQKHNLRRDNCYLVTEQESWWTKATGLSSGGGCCCCCCWFLSTSRLEVTKLAVICYFYIVQCELQAVDSEEKSCCFCVYYMLPLLLFHSSLVYDNVPYLLHADVHNTFYVKSACWNNFSGVLQCTI
ncbi:Uncharacterized protein Fot_19737 [Forsythia ovata]|uniref:Uncharacterized protein n=1 Tax=Forsythia ovata TaxID=205694 RepID=A0ABD1VLV4_9LAMI